MSVISELAIAVQSGIPVLLWGAPGVGKTSAITQMAEVLDLHLEVVIASVREPADFAGLPVIREAGVVMEPPAWAQRLAKAGRGLLFLDEISTAAPAVQAALLRVVLDRWVGDMKLPDGVSVVAAANPPEQAAGGWDLSAPLANRFCHLTWALDPQAWVRGMLSGWGTTAAIPRLPSNWRDEIPAAKTLVAAFIHHRPSLLSLAPATQEQAGRAWPSPRSWDMASVLLGAANAAGADEDVTTSLVAGCVGNGPALEFLVWKKELDLPDPEEVLAHPGDFQVPGRGDKAFAILAAVVTAAVGDLTSSRWMAAWQVLARAAEQGAKDVAAVSAQELAAARKPGFPLPQKELREFIPLLKAGGLM